VEEKEKKLTKYECPRYRERITLSACINCLHFRGVRRGNVLCHASGRIEEIPPVEF